jgi:uncharacterized damage-inducible protein DinB
MIANDIFAPAYKANLEMLKMHLADLSDADLLTRPVPGANHANWQLGHLIKSEAGMITGMGGTMTALPAGFHEKYEAKTAALDDPSAFLTKQELLQQFEIVRAASIAFAQAASDDFLKQPAPERMRRMVANNADMLGLLIGHTMMHVGQIQVLRRKLGKPILF